jgi:hypothetical protein
MDLRLELVCRGDGVAFHIRNRVYRLFAITTNASELVDAGRDHTVDELNGPEHHREPALELWRDTRK